VFLDVCNRQPGVQLIPTTVEVLGNRAQLDYQIAGQDHATEVNTISINPSDQSCAGAIELVAGTIVSGFWVSFPTIKRLEAQDGPLGGREQTIERILSTIQAAGIEFIDENGGGAGVRLRKRQKKG
jgi:hypothetical protein